MFWPSKKMFLAGWVLALCLPNAANAAPTNAPWATWLIEQINQHPDVSAARQSMLASFSLATGAEQPLYNPELETDIEREGDDNNYRIGISQTVDWWDKRAVQEQQAGFSRLLAKASYQQALQQKTADTLLALIRWRSAKQQAELAREQETQLDTLLQLISDRERMGDLGQLDTELTFLSLSERLNITALALSEFKKSEAALRELLPNWAEKSALIPEQLWSVMTQAEAPSVDSHPAVMASKAQWQVQQQGTELARRKTNADPNFGVNGGRMGNDNVVALTFSMPLYVRNKFSAEAQAASEQALSAEASYYAVRRQQQAYIEAASDTLLAYQQQYQRWNTLISGREQRSGQLLNQKWLGNDMSTTEYLLASAQRNEGIVAGIELREQFHIARVNWLLQTGSINTALAQLAQ
jgi:outer membrane protein TolC